MPPVKEYKIESISEAPPSALDIRQTAELKKVVPNLIRVASADNRVYSTAFLQFLQDQGLYESVAESSLREDVLGTLDKLVKDWVKKVGRAAELADSFVADSNAKIFTFGSYRLGVHGPGT